MNHAFGLGSGGFWEEVRRLPMPVLWSDSWSDMWIDEGKKVAAALLDAKFVLPFGGRWPQVTYHPLDVLRLRLAVQSGHSTLSQNEGICLEKYKNRRETSLATALLSATFATLMCYPLDTVRSQMQMKGTPHNTVSDAISGNVLNTLFTGLNSPGQFCRRYSPEKTTDSPPTLSVYYPQRRSEGRPQQHLPRTHGEETGIAPNSTHLHMEQIHNRAERNINIIFFICLAQTGLHVYHKDMGGHHEDSLIRKERRWAAATASHGTRGPSSSIQPPVTDSQTGASQPLPMPIPIQVTPEDLDHEDATDTPATPPATLSAAEIVTPEVGKTYTHTPTLAEDMIPKVGMFFDTEEHAYEMFRRYAKATGFPIKWDRKKHTVRDISCSMSGTWKYYKPEQQRTRNKFTKKTGCKVYMKLKHVSDMEGNNNGKVSDVAEMFKGLDRENKTFTLMHCWNKLKGEDKCREEENGGAASQ
ncbi:unnamed protein product [Miscanthus lutarioriparius]|uniref:Protein FAR1-RELATED SEQUENCE n=1 Tax=Miscanthus lutarioriparius TaxID=422564 RepID=A0A811RQD8_9POAL|nr:unnamed protein product [Miscanthus lutarioriparius]